MEGEAMSERLHIMRACVAMRVAMGHLEKAEGVEQAAKLLLVAFDLLAEDARLTSEEVADAAE
jgi:hypothetical protein